MKLHAPDLSRNNGTHNGKDGLHTVPKQAPQRRNTTAPSPAPFGLHPRSRWNASLSIMVLTLLLAWNTFAAELECRTFERFRADFMAAMELSDGTCPVFGSADNPAVRNSFIPTGATSVKTIRLRFHVFANSDGSSPASTPAVVDQVVTEMNNYYRPWKIQFVHTTRQVNDSRYRSLADAEEYAMKDAHAQSPETQHNVFVVNVESPYNGWGTFPWMGEVLTRQGGTVMDDAAFRPGATTLPHELGHGLGLWHTHHGVSEVAGCTACYERPGAGDRDMTGDFCSDTPPTPRSWDCASAAGADICSGQPWGATDYQNLMSYSSCRNHFTSQQAGRMHAWITEKLTGWLNTPTVPPARTLYVDRNYTWPNPNGSSSAPYPTVKQGFTAAQNGDVLKVRTGDYGVPALLAGKAVRFEPENGPVTFRLAPEPPTAALVVSAGPDKDIPTGNVTDVTAAAQLISTGPVTSWHWEKVSGPGRVFSQNYDAATLSFWVSSSGTYELKVTASNGQLTGSDTVRVTFREPVLYVNAGRNQEVPFPWTGSLAGSVLVDERPNADATFRWRKSSGPGAVTFSSSTSLATGVTVSQRGVYYCYLEAWYRGKYRAARVTMAFGVPLPCCSVADETEENTVLEPFLEAAREASGAMRLTVLSPDSKPCMIQRSENLKDWNDWQAMNPTNGMATITDTQARTNAKQFYRVKVQ